MYQPVLFRPSDPGVAARIVAENPFGMLLDAETAEISHLPMLLARLPDGSLRLRGHVARANPISKRLAGHPLVAVFSGPHAYVTPRWYAEPHRQVPTWNYVVAEVRGRGRAMTEGETKDLLADLCARFEPPDGYGLDWVAPDFVDELIREIAGFEVVVDTLQGKLKLSQNRSKEDFARVLDGLSARAHGDDAAVARWMRTLP